MELRSLSVSFAPPSSIHRFVRFGCFNKPCNIMLYVRSRTHISALIFGYCWARDCGGKFGCHPSLDAAESHALCFIHSRDHTKLSEQTHLPEFPRQVTSTTQTFGFTTRCFDVGFPLFSVCFTSPVSELTLFKEVPESWKEKMLYLIILSKAIVTECEQVNQLCLLEIGQI